jgi:hypothetical protein
MDLTTYNLVLDDLERRRDLLNSAISGLRMIMGQGMTAPAVEPQRPPAVSAATPPSTTEPVSHPIGPKAKRPYKRKGDERHCDKHPDNRKDFAPNGSCRPCTREYNRNRHASIKAGTWNDDPAEESGETETAPPAPAVDAQAPPAEEDRKFIYSKLVKCTKCDTERTRFKRVAGAQYWICMANRCAVKVDNVHMPVDKAYEGAA